MNEWILLQDKYPPEDELVLTYSKRSQPYGYGLGSWHKQDNFPTGKRWTINDTSGGVGTSYEIKPPHKWMSLPKI